MIGNLNYLSDDELLTIFFFLPNEQIFNILPYVCKRFYKVFKGTWIQNYYYKHFYTKNHLMVKNSKINWLMLCSIGVRKLKNFLDVSAVNAISFGFQKTLQKTTRKLKLFTNISNQTEYIIAGQEGGKIEVWSKTFNSSKWIEEASLKCHVNEITCLEVNDCLVSGSKDYDICIFDNQFEKMLHKLQKHQDWVRDIKFIENQKKIISISRDKSFIIWDIIQGDDLVLFKDFKSLPWFLESSSHILIGDTSGNLGVFSQKGEKIDMIKAHKDLISGIKLVNNYIYTSSYDRFIKLWDIRKLKDPIGSIEAHDAPIYSLDYDNILVSSSIDGNVKSWKDNLTLNLNYLNPSSVHKLNDEEPKFQLPTRREVVCKVFKGRIYSNNDPDQSITVWDQKYAYPQTSFSISKDEALTCFEFDINKLVTATILNNKPKLNVFNF